MPRKKGTPGVAAYYDALQDVFRLESRVLTGVLPHSGERGQNDEERFRAFLSRVLPRRFSVGSGFIVCSEPNVPPSGQTDVVLFDEIYNSPLHREFAAFVYPIEMVYGFVEVKGTLTPANLLKTCHDIRKVREMGQHQHYLEYTSVAKDPNRPKQSVVVAIEDNPTLPPRSFVFAYEKKGWKTIGDLVAALRDAVSKTNAHIHGLAVLSENWYVAQEAHAGGRKFHAEEGDALMKFVRGMLHSIASRRIRQMSIDRYLRATAPESPEPPVLPAVSAKVRRARKRRGRRRP